MKKRQLIKAGLQRLLGREKPVEPVVSSPVSAAEPAQEEVEEMPEVEVNDEVLAQWLSDDEETVLLDIREPMETRSGTAKGALIIPMNTVPSALEELPEKSTRLLVYCAAGVRSFGVTHWLREQGWENAWSVTSGFSGVLAAGGELQRE